MQSPFIMSFRARLKFLGYTDIHIKKAKMFKAQDIYLVTCKDPFCGILCERYMDEIDMYNWR